MKQKALIFGFGRSNQALLAHLLKTSEFELAVYDSRGESWLESFDSLLKNVEVISDESSLMSYPLWFVSPGIASNNPLLVKAELLGVILSNDIEHFIRYLNKPFVAVTGSNGKSTITAMVHHLGKSVGLNMAIGGNYGVPVYELNQDADCYVLELSSFQLHYIKNLAATVAVFSNLSSDHLDWHGDIEHYYRAKQNVFNGAEYQIYNLDDTYTHPNPSLTMPCHHQVGVSPQADPVLFNELLFLHGKHQRLNAMMAISVGLCLSWKKDTMLDSLKSFRALPHRMQYLGTKQERTFFNDSKATNVASTLAALEGFIDDSSATVYVLLGGKGKGQDFSSLGEAFQHGHMQAVCFGESAQDLAKVIPHHLLADSFKEAFYLALEQSQSGDVILLSPACASFDEFNNFEARGDYFISLFDALEA